MKKFYFLFAFMALFMLASCGDDDHENKQTATVTLNCRAIDINTGDVVFSQSTGQVEINYTDMTLRFSCTYKDLDGMSHTLNTPSMAMKSYSNACYRFESPNGLDSGQGVIDLSTGMMEYNFGDTEQGTSVMITTHLLYAYTTTKVTTAAGSVSSHDQSAYLFALDSKGESCVMEITNFSTTGAGSIIAAAIDFDGIEVTPTATGYSLTATEVESNTGGHTITDLDIIIDNNCHTMNGTFVCDGSAFEVSGRMWNLNTYNISPITDSRYY